MNLSMSIIVLLICLYQEGIQAKQCPCKDRYFPVGRAPDERSITLTISNISASSELTVSIVGGREETVINSLMRAADSDKKFEFSGKYTSADGFCLTGIQDKTNGDDGNWEVATTAKDGSDSVPIKIGLEKFTPNDGETISFRYVAPELKVTTISFELADQGTVTEGDQIVATIIRTGDTSTEASVIIYTEAITATEWEDYFAKGNEENSRQRFEVGQETIETTLITMGDVDEEPVEQLKLNLASPRGEGSVVAKLGQINTTTISIEDPQGPK